MTWRDYSLFNPNQRNICLYSARFSCIFELREADFADFFPKFAWLVAMEGGLQRPVLRVNESKSTDTRSAVVRNSDKPIR
jgi:hypothetical protein